MRAGFTLIELMIVLAIIGALMSIGIPIYTNALQSARAVVVAANMRMIVDTVRMDLILNGHPSATASGTEYDISQYVKIDDYQDYKLTIEDKGNSFDVKVIYSGASAKPDLVLEKLSGCATKTMTDDNYPLCELEVSKSF